MPCYIYSDKQLMGLFIGVIFFIQSVCALDSDVGTYPNVDKKIGKKKLCSPARVHKIADRLGAMVRQAFTIKKQELVKLNIPEYTLRMDSEESLKDSPFNLREGKGNTFESAGGFGFSIIHYEGDGVIRGSDFVYCSRLLIHLPDKRILVDSHLPVNSLDETAFTKDFQILLRKLKTEGIDISKAKIYLLYGKDEVSEEGLTEHAEAILDAVMNSGLSVHETIPIPSDDLVVSFNTVDGSFKMSEEGIRIKPKPLGQSHRFQKH